MLIQNFRFAGRGFGGQALHVSDDVVLAYKTHDAADKTNTYYFTGTKLRRPGWIMIDVTVPEAR